MNIEKVKEAKNYLYDAISCILRGAPVRDLDERIYALDAALAELEKPAEDDAFHSAKELTGIIGQLEYSLYREGVLGDLTGKAYSNFGSRMMAEMISPIQEKLQQYAESYHAKKEKESIKRAVWLYRETCGGCGEECDGDCVHIRQLKTAITGKPNA